MQYLRFINTFVIITLSKPQCISASLAAIIDSYHTISYPSSYCDLVVYLFTTYGNILLKSEGVIKMEEKNLSL